MNLAERIKAKRLAEENYREQLEKAEHERRMAELGKIPFEEILEYVEDRFNRTKNNFIYIYTSETSGQEKYGVFQNPIEGLREVNEIPFVWMDAVASFLEENGFRIPRKGFFLGNVKPFIEIYLPE